MSKPFGECGTSVDYMRGQRRVTVWTEDDGAESEASLTPRDARRLAIAILANAERCERYVARKGREVARGVEAKHVALEALQAARGSGQKGEPR